MAVASLQKKGGLLFSPFNSVKGGDMDVHHIGRDTDAIYISYCVCGFFDSQKIKRNNRLTST